MKFDKTNTSVIVSYRYDEDQSDDPRGKEL